jgi:hypothetical protein
LQRSLNSKAKTSGSYFAYLGIDSRYQINKSSSGVLNRRIDDTVQLFAVILVTGRLAYIISALPKYARRHYSGKQIGHLRPGLASHLEIVTVSYCTTVLYSIMPSFLAHEADNVQWSPTHEMLLIAETAESSEARRRLWKELLIDKVIT